MSLTVREIERQLKKISRCCENNRCRLDIIDGELVLVDTRLDDLEADVETLETNVDDHETRITVLEGSSGGTAINVVANYSALPDPTTVSGEFYYAQASQGTAWLPGNLGGTYRKAGLYYSNGVDWLIDVNPWQAAQADVDAGIITDQFVSPATLAQAQTIVLSVAKSGEAQIKGDVTLSEGGNITLTQVGNDIEIASTGGSSPAVISPAQITADQDDYSPTDWATATIVRLSFDDSIPAITGFAAKSDGDRVTVFNISGNSGYIPGEHPDSSAANRVITPKDFMILPYSQFELMYDGSSSRWRVIGDDSGGTGLFYEWSPGSITLGDYSEFGFAAISGGGQSSVSSTTLPGANRFTSNASSTGGFVGYFNKTSSEFTSFGAAHIFIESLISIPTLSDGSETFTVEIQLAESPSSTALEVNNTIGLRYSSGINSGEWELFSQDNAGAESVADCNVSVAAATLYRLRIEHNKSNTEARAYINDTYVGRVAGNMPNSVVCGARVIIVKSAGTTARTLNVHSFSAGAIYV